MKLLALSSTIALAFTGVFACVHLDPKCCATLCAPQPPCEQRSDGGPQ